MANQKKRAFDGNFKERAVTLAKERKKEGQVASKY